MGITIIITYFMYYIYVLCTVLKPLKSTYAR